MPACLTFIFFFSFFLDAAKEDIDAAVRDFRKAQEIAALAIHCGNAEASEKGLWTDERPSVE